MCEALRTSLWEDHKHAGEEGEGWGGAGEKRLESEVPPIMSDKIK